MYITIVERERTREREREREKLTKVGRIINTGEFLVLFYREFWLHFLETPDAKCFTHFSSLLSGLLIFMTKWEMMLNGTTPSVMVSYNDPPTHQSGILRTSYHCQASWGLKNLSPGTHSPTPSLPFLMEGRSISLLQCNMPAHIDHAEIRWQFDPLVLFSPPVCCAGFFTCHLGQMVSSYPAWKNHW